MPKSPSNKALVSWLQVTPLFLVLLVFLVAPLAVIVVVSFWDYSIGGMYPDFIWLNYQELFRSAATADLYLRTLKFVVIVWAVTLVLGFSISYFLTYCVTSTKWRMFLFLLCTIPFWTSNVIRMIAWVPFLGRNGAINQTLIEAGLVDEPLDFLLFSEFAVLLTYVHLYTLFMIVPIFNSMAKIDLNVIEAARDAGATGLQVLTQIIVPLTVNGIALGSIFIVTLVMGDFYIVRVMSGSQSGTVASTMAYEIAGLQYPAAAADAVILMVVVILIVSLILRVVDVRKVVAE